MAQSADVGKSGISSRGIPLLLKLVNLNDGKVLQHKAANISTYILKIDHYYNSRGVFMSGRLSGLLSARFI